jgi:hypothetical protein
MHRLFLLQSTDSCWSLQFIRKRRRRAVPALGVFCQGVWDEIRVQLLHIERASRDRICDRVVAAGVERG